VDVLLSHSSTLKRELLDVCTFLQCAQSRHPELVKLQCIILQKTANTANKNMREHTRELFAVVIGNPEFGKSELLTRNWNSQIATDAGIV
jgi:hypothetical protein